jgi:hypothetical protein
MSKKKFSEGLDDLFSDSHSAQAGLLDTHAAVAPPERRPAHKNFMSDLDALLQEALEESLDRYETQQAEASSGKTKAATQRPALTGLDALIRQTVDIHEVVADENTGKKRLTVTVDKAKLEKLRTIARLENAYMKDLLVQLIDAYIEEYVQQKGVNL